LLSQEYTFFGNCLPELGFGYGESDVSVARGCGLELHSESGCQTFTILRVFRPVTKADIRLTRT